MEKIFEVISKMKDLIENIEFKIEYRKNPENFTRATKLTFARTIIFVLSLMKTTLDCEIENFFEDEEEVVTAAAISEARGQIKHEAFKTLLNEQAKYIPSEKRLKGYQIIALDGMEFELPRTPELMKKYAPSEKSLYPMAHSVSMFDVLNKKFLDAKFMPCPTDERKQAKELVSMQQAENPIFLFDRGFPSIALIQQLMNNEKKFLMRCSSSFIKEVNAFKNSSATDEIVTINYTKSRAQGSKTKGVELPFLFDLRCSKVILESGEIELLISNLSLEEFSLEELGELYFLRWGIEVSYNHLKNAFNIEMVVGKTENSIIQEFFASLIVYNLSVMLCDLAEQSNTPSKKTKLEYKINFRKAVAKIQKEMKKLLQSSLNLFSTLYSKLIKKISKFKSAVRPGRSFPRRKTSCKHPIQYRRNIFS